ncbi:DUF6483 family protein [Loigolactobacillus binensis]|uniref:DUF6483 family protein n=1 Tax=Loigolactobacillus binensis TaxID=2559922 RepID=A0ABW3EGJ4_9LACO|nr:DUF6483 family protein [Loigolactobacillus binensis]
MQNESDYIMRQIKAFAEGLGYIMSQRKNNTDTEIVFHMAEPLLPHQLELQQLIAKKQYAAVAKRLLALQYAMPEGDFFKLSVWFYDTLNQRSDTELQQNNYSRSAIIAGLKQLQMLQAEKDQ